MGKRGEEERAIAHLEAVLKLNREADEPFPGSAMAEVCSAIKKMRRRVVNRRWFESNLRDEMQPVQPVSMVSFDRYDWYD